MIVDAFEPNAQRLSILLGSRDHAGHHSLAVEILGKARSSGFAGATLLQAERGVGRSGVVHEEHLLREDAPLCILIVDSKDRISWLVGELRSLRSQVRLVVTDVDATRA